MSEFNRILKHSVIYGVGNILTKMIGFLLIPVYTQVLSTEKYGLMELLQNTQNVIGIIVGMGLATAILRFYSEDKSREARETVVSTSVIFTTIVGAAVAGLCILFSSDLSLLILKNKGHAEPFTVMMFWLFFANMIEVPMVVIRAQERSAVYVMVCLAQLILGLVLNIVFIVFLRLGVAGWLLSSLWTSVVICLYVVISTLSRVEKIRFSFPLLKRMLVYTIPLIPAALAMFWIHNGDRYILNAAYTTADVGVYSLGYRFAMMIPFLIGQPFFLIWSVRMFDVFENNGGEKVYARTFTYFTAVILIFWLLLAATIKEVVMIMSDEQYHQAYIIVHVVAMGYVLREFSDFFKGVLLIRRRTSFIGYTTGFSALVATVLYLILIPKYGMWGAAWATLFTFGAMAASMFVAGQYVHKVPYEYKRLLIMAGLALVILFTSRYISFSNIYLNMAVKSLLAISFIPILYLFRFFRDDEKAQIAAAWVKIRYFYKSWKTSS